MNSNEIKLPTEKKDSWKFFDEIAGTYDPINKVLSFGTDILWRKNFRKHLPDQRDLQCLDLATGTADVAIELARDEKVKHVTATDLSEKMLEIGKQKVQKMHMEDKVTIEVGDGVIIPSPDQSMDVITVSFGIRNFKDYKTSLSNMIRVLKPGGRVMILEFSLPRNRLFRKLYLFYFRTILPKIGNLLSKHPFAYSYLNKTVETFPYGEEFVQAMKDTGFRDIQAHPLTFGIATFYIGIK